jgi:DNA-binding LacI/PurR family transcriptional regulator
MDNQQNGRAVTQRDVARHAGVSASVVSYVINDGTRYVAEETRARVLKAIDELGYRPNKFAQGLRSEKLRTHREIGIVIGSDTRMFKRPFWAAVMAGVYEEAYREGRRIRFMHFFNDLSDPILFNEYINPDDVSDLILIRPAEMVTTPENRRLVERIIERINNIVCLGESIYGLPAVIFDLNDAACKAVQHLIDLGHQAIAYVGTDDGRVSGYTETLLRAGIALDSSLIYRSSELPPKAGYDLAQDLIASGNLSHITGIFASSDEMAIGVMGALYDIGYRIPEQIALVSVDDIANASMIRPALTTIHVPKELMGNYALRLLDTQRSYADVTPVSIVLPTQLIVRQSSGIKLKQSF